MYAPHFAAALAIKARTPEAPLWALLTGAFVPDLLWIVLARIGIEPAQTSNFFDGWSHSLISVVVLATLYALPFLPKGRSRMFRRLARSVLPFRAGFSGPSKETCSRTNDPHLPRVGLPRMGFAARLVRRCQRLVAAAFRPACAAIRICHRSTAHAYAGEPRRRRLCGTPRAPIPNAFSPH